MSRRDRERAEGHLSDPGVQDKLRREERRLQAADAKDLEDVLKTAGGRRLYYRLCFLLAGLESASYDASGQRMAFLEGRRDVAITLRDEALHTCPELWTRMVEERVAAWVDQQAARAKALETPDTENDNG